MVHNISLWDTTNCHANQNPLFTVQSSENTRCCKPPNVFLVRQVQMRITFGEKCLVEFRSFQNPGPRLKHGFCWHPQTHPMWIPHPQQRYHHTSPGRRWSWFSMARKTRVQQHYSWMNGITFRTFISCLKDWRTCSWLRFCFPETGYLVYGPVESSILPLLLYFMYTHLLPHLIALTWSCSVKV